jgi:phage gpG-like protein
MSKAAPNVKIVYNNFGLAGKAVTGDQLMKACLNGAGVVEFWAKRNASSGRPGLNVDTGNLVNSISSNEARKSATYAEVEIGTGVEYAAIHEFGGIIHPKAAKMLSWVQDNVRIFAKMVQIPARPYLRPAMDEHETDILAAIETSLKNQLEAVCK